MASLRCISYNMHGFCQGYPAVHELCKTHNIILLQEHWLSSVDIGRLNDVNSNFVCHFSSAIDTTISKGVLRGRPFGGVAILVDNVLATRVNFVFKAERFIVLHLDNLVVINLHAVPVNC